MIKIFLFFIVNINSKIYHFKDDKTYKVGNMLNVLFDGYWKSAQEN